ncbi:MAG: zinc ABC transporter substrate-binding protein [Clostridia bacterium]|nr:zinc ABC transporter substrate-binding protein [Clostridia bacterium]
MRKKALGVFALILMCILLTGCIKIDLDLPDPMPITVYTSFFPVYVLAEAITRDIPNLTVYCLTQPQNGCLRSYTLSDWDAALLAVADIFVSCGIEDASFFNALSDAAATVDLSRNLPLIESTGTEESHFNGLNPWYFLSVSGMRSMLAVFAGAMAQLDPDCAALYEANRAAADEKLASLEAEMKAIYAAGVPEGAILMQEGLEYIAQEAGIGQYLMIEREAGAPMGDNEYASALKRMKGSGYSTILTERQVPDSLATLLEADGFTVIKLDIMNDHLPQDGLDGYISGMLGNTRAISQAFVKEISPVGSNQE